MAPDHKVLRIDTISKLVHIFNSNHWPFPNVDDALFTNFCELLSVLRSDEQELILILTEDFLRITYFEYLAITEKVLQKVDYELYDKSDRIFVLPLTSPRDRKKGVIKSSHNLLYLIKHECINKNEYFHKIKRKVEVLSSLDALNDPPHCDRNNALLIFFDDFIGSGQTACEAMWDYWMSFRRENDSAIIVSLVVQDRGVNLLKRHFIDVYSEYVRMRGISDSAKIENKKMALKIMDRIESRLRVSKQFRRGYDMSESLVSMIRTPNNTFPVYWVNKAKNGTPWPAPFRR